MGLDTVKKPAKMAFTIENLAKSSRDEQPQKLDTTSDTSLCTPVKFHSEFVPMTSTPLSLPLVPPKNEGRLKRKRHNSIESDNSSLNSTSSKSRDSLSPNTSSDDPENSESRKKARIAFTNSQVTELEKCFISSKYLPIEERAGLSQKLQLSEQQIKTWFQNRRMKEKRQHKDGKSCHFPSGGVDISQLVAMGIPCPPPHSINSTPSTHLPGYVSHHQQFPGSPSPQQMYDPRFMSSYTYGYSPMSPITFTGYNQQMYSGQSPPTLHQRM